MWCLDALRVRLPTEKTRWEGKETLPGPRKQAKRPHRWLSICVMGENPSILSHLLLRSKPIPVILAINGGGSNA
jgi:hypothetical protein